MIGVSGLLRTSRKRIRRKLELPDISALYLTLKDDPRNSMVVTYHLVDTEDPVDVYYREKGTSDTWQTVSPTVIPFPNEDKNICHCNLSGLTADTSYDFKVGDNGDVRFFDTLPNDLSSPILGAFGADYQDGPSMWAQITGLIADNYDVKFFVIGGDWVNDDGSLSRSYAWVDFWDDMWQRYIRPDGRMIPLVPIMGNHEMAGSIGGEPDMAELFFEKLFAFPDEGFGNYGVIDIGDYMSLIALDTTSIDRYLTGETGNKEWAQRWENEIGSTDISEHQKSWLEGVLDARSNVDYVIPLPHVPFFPSHRKHLEEAPDFDRDGWIEMLYNKGIKMIFSGHDHTYKKTHEMIYDTNEIKIAGEGENGMIEFGDGGLGNKYYSGNLHGEFYMDETAAGFSHFKIAEFSATQAVVTSYDENNNQIGSQTTIVL